MAVHHTAHHGHPATMAKNKADDTRTSIVLCFMQANRIVELDHVTMT